MSYIEKTVFIWVIEKNSKFKCSADAVEFSSYSYIKPPIWFKLGVVPLSALCHLATPRAFVCTLNCWGVVPLFVSLCLTNPPFSLYCWNSSKQFGLGVVSLFASRHLATPPCFFWSICFLYKTPSIIYFNSLAPFGSARMLWSFLLISI